MKGGTFRQHDNNDSLTARPAGRPADETIPLSNAASRNPSLVGWELDVPRDGRHNLGGSLSLGQVHDLSSGAGLTSICLRT